MKKSLIQTIVTGGHTYGQVSNPNDLMKAEQFVHDRISQMAADFINNERRQEVSGFSYSLGGGNAFNIQIHAPGRVWTQDGISYDAIGSPTLTIAAADSTQPRLDLVVAVIEDEVNAGVAMIPFVRLRTSDEFGSSTPAYPPSNFNEPTELQWKATAQIKTGTPAAIPTPPTVATNEVPLYLIAVAPGATQIRDADVLDLRGVVLTLRKLNEFTAQDRIDIAKLRARMAKLEDLAGQPVDLSQVFGEIRSLGDILSSLQRQINASRDVPEIRYFNPKLALTDKATSQIPATGHTASSVPYVDIEIGAKVNFGDTEVAILPQWFKDGSVNARFAQTGGGGANVTRATDLIMANVTQIAADGATDFVERSSVFTAPRGRPASAARNGQYIEVFGGLASDNFSKLSDWHTYDLLNDTLTSRTPGSSLPTSDRPALFPCGDGTNVMMIAGSESNATPRCFKVNASTMAVTECSTTKPTGIQFFGDLIAPGKVFIVAIRKVTGGFETDFWEYDTAANTFTALGVTGSLPDPDLDCADGCFYGVNKFVMVQFTPGVPSSGTTYVFDRGSLQWTELYVAPPFGDTADRQTPLVRFRMANVNGRPLLIGGLLTQDTDGANAKVWELKTGGPDSEQMLAWQSWNATFPPVQDPGFCSALGAVGTDSYAVGSAFFFAGAGKYSDAKNRVYSSVQGGLVATTFGGVDAITIADSSTYAQFVIAPFTAAWAVAGYMATLAGQWDQSSIKVEASFDAGGHWHTVTPDQLLFVTDSSAPGDRRIRITLYNLKSSKKPILTKLTEIFDQNGVQLESRIVIRYNSPGVVKALYLNRDGTVELSTDILPSTPDRCLVLKTTPHGTGVPDVKCYINRRRPHFKYTGTAGALAATHQFDNEFAVPVRYVDARAVHIGAMLKIADPTVDFDAVVDVAGVSSGDDWIVELEG